jgi:hypothetical protein
MRTATWLRRGLAVLLVGLVSAALLTGCGRGKDKDAAKTEEQAEGDKPELPSLDADLTDEVPE